MTSVKVTSQIINKEIKSAAIAILQLYELRHSEYGRDISIINHGLLKVG